MLRYLAYLDHDNTCLFSRDRSRNYNALFLGRVGDSAPVRGEISDNTYPPRRLGSPQAQEGSVKTSCGCAAPIQESVLPSLLKTTFAIDTSRQENHVSVTALWYRRHGLGTCETLQLDQSCLQQT